MLNSSQLCTGHCPSAFQLLVLGFLSWVQSCFYPSVSSNDLGYLRPGAHGAHCAWLCSQLSLFYLCPLGVLLWPGPRIRAPPSVRLPGHSSPGQKHAMCYRNKDALACWVPRSALGGVHQYPHSIHLIPAITALSDTPQNLHSTDLHLLCLSKSLSTAKASLSLISNLSCSFYL